MRDVDRATGRVPQIVGERSEVRVAVLGANREVVGEGVFDTATDGVADTGVLDLVDAERAHIRVAQATEGSTAGAINQHAVERDAEATTDRPLDAVVGGVEDASRRQEVGRASAGAVDIAFDAEHAAGAEAVTAEDVAEHGQGLRGEEVANMAATDHAVLAGAGRIENRTGSSDPRDGVGLAELVADLTTDVEAGPGENRDRRRRSIHRRRTARRKVGRKRRPRDCDKSHCREEK